MKKKQDCHDYYYTSYYTSAEVAEIFNVHPATVTRWARAGLLTHTRDPQYHHMYLISKKEVDALAKKMKPKLRKSEVISSRFKH